MDVKHLLELDDFEPGALFIVLFHLIQVGQYNVAIVGVDLEHFIDAIKAFNGLSRLSLEILGQEVDFLFITTQLLGFGALDGAVEDLLGLGFVFLEENSNQVLLTGHLFLFFRYCVFIFVI